jgi:hypothetical protein
LANYIVNSTDQGPFTGSDYPLNAVRAYYKVRELRDLGCRHVALQNSETGENVVDVETLMRDSPYA